MITGLYAGLLGLLLVVLSVRVIGYRGAKGISIGDNGDEIMLRRIRAQGNLVEYAPLALILLALAEIQGLPSWLVHLFGLILLAGRLSHAAALSSPTPRPVFRVGGMALTFLALGVLSVTSLVLVFL
ncbi:MAG: MAPEG family protein [Pseudomonadota bacterium]